MADPLLRPAFKHGETVRLVTDYITGRPFGTPSQRCELWVVDLSDHKNNEDLYWSHITIHRSSDPDCLMHVRRDLIQSSTVLDLLANV